MEEKRNPRRGFSLIEVLATLAAVAVLAGVGIYMLGVGDKVTDTKLKQDVRALNQAVKVYIANGGNIGADWDAEEVLRVLKAEANNAEERRNVGLNGSMIDDRLGFVRESNLDSVSAAARWVARWSGAEKRFVLEHSRAGGITKFVLEDRFASDAPPQDGRRTAMLYAEQKPWVWDYQDRDSQRPDFRETPTGPAPPSPGLLPTPGPSILPLAPPEFSHPEGTYPHTSFDLPVTLTAKNNVPGTFEIFVSIDGGPFEIYAGEPLTVPRGVAVTAFTKSIDPDHYSDGPSETVVYSVEEVQLEPPTITPEYAHFDAATQNRIAVEIADKNDPQLPKVVRYRVEGGPWKEYLGPFVLDIADYPSGAVVEAGVFGLESWVLDSEKVSTLLKRKLAPPEFAVSNPEGIAANVAITNPNPPASSDIDFRTASLPAGDYGAVATFSEPLSFAGEDYPEGVRIAARAVSGSERYIDSDEVAVDIALVDPDDWTIEGETEGSFADAAGGADLVTSFSQDPALFTWGEGQAPLYMPSALTFDGSSFSGVGQGEIFKIGDIDYYNGTISSGTGADSVSFAVEVGFKNGRSISFDVPLELINVPNVRDGDWNLIEDESADYVRIPNSEFVQPLRLYGRDYQLAIGFGETEDSAGDASLTEFHVWEHQSAGTELFAAILNQEAVRQGVEGWMRSNIKQFQKEN